MSKRTPKNVGRSIRERLLNIYKEGKHECKVEKIFEGH